MDDLPQTLPYARPDLNRAPPDDGQVRVGAQLQLLASLPCFLTQYSEFLAPSRPLASALARGLACVSGILYPTLAVVAFAGSVNRNPARRRLLYGVYMVGTAVYLTLFAVAVFHSSPTTSSEPLWLHLGALALMAFLNPAAIWIGGRWVIWRVFPAMRR